MQQLMRIFVEDCSSDMSFRPTASRYEAKVRIDFQDFLKKIEKSFNKGKEDLEFSQGLREISFPRNYSSFDRKPEIRDFRAQKRAKAQ